MKSFVLRLTFAHRIPMFFSIPAVSLAASGYTIADTTHCSDVTWTRGVLFQFLAQIADMHVYHMVIIILVAPDLLQQLRAGEDASGMPRQCREQRELSGGQRNLCAVTRDGMPILINDQRPNTQGRRRWSSGSLAALTASARASQQRLDPRDDLARAKRLRDVIVGADG